LPSRATDLGETLRALDAAAHGADVSADAAATALDAGTRLLNELRRLLEVTLETKISRATPRSARHAARPSRPTM
jgi:hypothetical protein